MHAPGAGAGCACPAATECVYICGHAEEVEPKTPGGRRDQRSLLLLPHPQDRELNWIPSASSILLLPPLFTREQVEASGELGARRGVCALFGVGNPWCHPGYPVTGRGSGILCPEEGGAQEKESLSNYGRRGDAL